MHRFLLSVVVLSLFSCLTHAQGMTAKVGKQHDMGKWDIPAGNYSGIAWLRDNRYAIISDKQRADGWTEVAIDIDPRTGDVKRMEFIADHLQSGYNAKTRDAEGIALWPGIHEPTLFISAESDQRIVETDLRGMPTGRELSVPKEMDVAHIHGNYGFEALAYSTATHLFWTTTENMLRADGAAAGWDNATRALLRVIAFNDSLQPVAQYAYATDAPTMRKQPKHYAFGVAAMTALEDGSLLTMEREFCVKERYFGSYATNKIYRTEPLSTLPITFNDTLSTLPSERFLKKTLIAEFTTRLNGQKMNIANYEGMCLGPALEDGSRVLLLISDSQDGYGNALFHLKDYIRTIVLRDNK